MKPLNLISVLFVSLISVSCSIEKMENLSEGISADSSVSKIINSPENADPSSLLLRLKDENAVCALSEVDGIAAVEPLFFSSADHADGEIESELTSWVKVILEEHESVTGLAAVLAESSDVEVIQYNSYMMKLFGAAPQSFAEITTKTAENGLIFNDPLLDDQWHYFNNGDSKFGTTAKPGADINVKDAWKLVAGDPDLVVAVIDEGVMYTHPDLEENMWVNKDEIPGNHLDDDNNGYVDDIHGYNFSDDTPEISWNKPGPDADHPGDSGHGTHVAGTVAAVNNNKIGVCGVAGGSGKGDGVRIMSCQIFSGGKVVTTDMICRAFRYAADNGAVIAQCSFGVMASPHGSDNNYLKTNKAEYEAINYFINHGRKDASRQNYPALKGGLVIFASGNDGIAASGYPGAYRDYISVSAFGPDYLPTYYTNYGPGCNISAPGGDIFLTRGFPPYKSMVLSTMPKYPDAGVGAYAYAQGTSMACPHASGVAALGLAYARKLGKVYDVMEFKDIFLSSVQDFYRYFTGVKYAEKEIVLPQYRGKLGTGAIDAWSLLMHIEGIPSIGVVTGKEQVVDLSPYFGEASVQLPYLDVETSPEVMESLGMTMKPYVKNGKLRIWPTKPGSGKIQVTAISGGPELGNGDNIGGMKFSQEISVIARSVHSRNGGWL